MSYILPGAVRGQFILDFLYFEHLVLVHSFVCVGGHKSGSSSGILEPEMQPHAERHCRKLDLGQ